MELYLLLSLLIMAFLFASVGHGGASGYHAIMALFLISSVVMKSSALTLNVFVAGISFYHYWKAGYFNIKVFAPFAMGSIPLAYLGGTIEIPQQIYKGILGFFLVFAVIKLLGVFGKESNTTRPLPFSLGILVGGLLGFVSGLIGIGGGIILSPVLLIFRWAKMKQAAAISALFILVNSISALIGLITSGNYSPHEDIVTWILFAIVGGFAGSYIGSNKMSNKGVKYLLALILLLASIKLLSAFFVYMIN
ncbi:MAG: sulfite exporter TauE/SafE family protein [Flavobacteriales bacterium]|jgi:uncharacterized protein|nr:sulfite exporter TauE/SafE family protein [Flavobacteriales bacterium]